MWKKILVGIVLLVVVLSAGLFFWARAVFGQDSVRNALAAQLSKSLGQPVTIGSVGATIYPRITVTLGTVAIGQPAKITVGSLNVGTDFRALLSRRIEHASLNLTGARIELPLPEFSIASSPPSAQAEPASAPVEIVSIDEIVLRDVSIVSGGRTLRGDIEIVPQGTGAMVRRISLTADKTTIEITGQITDFAGPAGELSVKAGALDFDDLQAFVSDFSASSSPSESSAPRPGMDLTVSMDADRATMGGLTLDKLSGRARLTPAIMALEPVGFGLFGGRYEGMLSLSLGAMPDYRLMAKISGIDMAAATAFAGSPNTITGRLSGTIDLAGRATDAATVTSSARGTVRVDITDGTVKNLGLIQNVVAATSGRTDVAQPGAGGSRDEPFTRIGSTLGLANGAATTDDLKLESKDVLMNAAGSLRLDGSAINFKAQVQLSDALSQQAGRDLVRYTQDQGRVTVPATITGSASNPQVRVDVTSLARRAITNKANEEAEKAIKGRLGGLLGR